MRLRPRIKQHGLLLLLEIASFLAKVHVDNNFYSKPVTKSIAAMTQARASFATGLLVADVDYRNFHGFNPWLPIRATCVKLKAFLDHVLKRKAEERQSALCFVDKYAEADNN